MAVVEEANLRLMKCREMIACFGLLRNYVKNSLREIRLNCALLSCRNNNNADCSASAIEGVVDICRDALGGVGGDESTGMYVICF